MDTVLIVDDELDIQSSLSFALKDEGFEVLTASSPDEAKVIIAKEEMGVALFDVWFPDGDGIELLQWTKEQHSDLSCIMMSGHGNIELALKSIRLGAYDFLEKPLELEKVLVVLRNALEAKNLRLENERLNKQLLGGADIIGKSAAVIKLKSDIVKAKQSTSSVLITGDNGTGKELVARALFSDSGRSNAPFVAVNCAAIPESLFESELFGHEKGSFTGAHSRKEGRFSQAGEGVLFLDEISELHPNSQSKLLRVLEEKTFERVGGTRPLRAKARIIAASNKDLQKELRDGRFREDLFFRLNVLPIVVPPLRDREEDVLAIAEHYVRLIAQEQGKSAPKLSSDLKEWMLHYDWPGNVRELKNLLERMIIMGSSDATLTLSDLPDELQNTLPSDGLGATDLSENADKSLRQLRAAFEKKLIGLRLNHFDGNVTRAAESLGVERAHLHRKIRLYGITS